MLPTLKEMGLHIENDDWAANITKHNTIELHPANICWFQDVKTYLEDVFNVKILRPPRRLEDDL